MAKPNKLNILIIEVRGNRVFDKQSGTMGFHVDFDFSFGSTKGTNMHETGSIGMIFFEPITQTVNH